MKKYIAFLRAINVGGTKIVPLDADAVNQALDDLENFSGDVRTVIVPASN